MHVSRTATSAPSLARSRIKETASLDEALIRRPTPDSTLIRMKSAPVTAAIASAANHRCAKH